MTGGTVDAERYPPSVPIDTAEVDGMIGARGRSPESAIPLLLDLQRRYGFLPVEALRRVSDATGVSLAELTGIASFFPRFRTAPAGRHTVRVCLGTACHVRGAGDVDLALRRHLGLAEGEDTDRDRLFTVERVACLGCCMLAPAVQIDEHIYGFVQPGTVGALLDDFLRGARGDGTPPGASTGAGPASTGEIRTCLCTSCRSSGSGEILREAAAGVKSLRLAATLKEVACTGASWESPRLEVSLPAGISFRYGRVRPEGVRRILLRHFTPAGPARRLAASLSSLVDRFDGESSGDPPTRYPSDARPDFRPPTGNPAVRVATEGAGQAGPLDIEEYLRGKGFAALRKSLGAMSPDGIVGVIRDSGLRGRGGAGYPAGEKWERVARAPGDGKFVVCNGDEGDPGAFMDRMLLESFPFRVLEGMAVAGRAVGASQGYLFIRNEYGLALERVRAAIAICEGRGILGSDVLGSGWSFRVSVVESAGAFVCGEETSLLHSIEGRRPSPRVRPPYPSETGLHGRPTLVNNVETLALVPWIIRRGPEAFRSLGTPGSAGTKTFALAGKVARGGLVEVPMGTTLREIVEGAGGGVPGGLALKAIQVGGPSGGCVPARLADTPVDYESLAGAGSIMGSGGMVVLDEADCMVDLARYFLSFAREESCGKCTFCRVGTRRMLEILEDLCRGRAGKGHVPELERLAGSVGRGSLCGLGRNAPNPVLSTLLHFREEYEAHSEGRCPAKRCRALIRYAIREGCIGCTRCAQTCPYGAIPMTPHRKHEVDDAACARCGACLPACPVGAVEVRDSHDPA